MDRIRHAACAGTRGQPSLEDAAARTRRDVVSCLPGCDTTAARVSGSRSQGQRRSAVDRACVHRGRLASASLPGEPPGLLHAPSAEVLAQPGVHDDRLDRARQARGVVGIEERPRLANDLRKRPGRGRDHGRAAGHRLENGQSEALVPERKDEDACQAVQGGQLVGRDVRDLPNPRRDAKIGQQPALSRREAPSALDEDRIDSALPKRRERPQQRLDVLPRPAPADMQDDRGARQTVRCTYAVLFLFGSREELVVVDTGIDDGDPVGRVGHVPQRSCRVRSKSAMIWFARSIPRRA
jgi:hypothetical protein